MTKSQEEPTLRVSSIGAILNMYIPFCIQDINLTNFTL